MKLAEYLGLPRQCVLIILDHNNGMGLVTYTINTPLTLARLYDTFKVKDLNLVVRSAGADIETLKLHCEYYKQVYHSVLGYQPWAAYGRKTIEYKVRKVPSIDLKGVDVELVTARGDCKVVGKFKTDREAVEFIETYYPAGTTPIMPVFALNSATKEFLLDKQTELLKLT